MNIYDPVLAKAIEGLSTQQAEDKVAADPELHGFARMANFNFAGKTDTAATLRKLMTTLGAPSYCDNPLCQRAGTCMTPKVRCFWENFDVMRRVVFPAMRRHLPELEAREEAERRAQAAGTARR